MGAIAQLSTTTLDVEPGRSAAMAFTVRNTGSVVDRFSFEAIGGAAGWVTFAPDSLSLFPEASGTVNILFNPLRLHTVTAGAMPFGIRITSAEDPAASVVEEGTLNVAPFSDISVELVPRIPRGSRMGRTQLAVDNRSNCPYRAELSGTDSESALLMAFNPAVVDVVPGGAVFAKVRIRPKQTFWRGPATTKPFRILLKNSPVVPAAAPVGAPAATPGDGPADGSAGAAGPGVGAAPTATRPLEALPANPHKVEIYADGSLMQESLLPSWFFKALAALVALAILAVILWFALLRPQIRSTAKNEVSKQLAAAGVSAPSGGSGSPSGGGGGGGGGGSTSTTVALSKGGSVSVTSAGGNIDGSYTASGNSSHAVYTVPRGSVLRVTDLLVENSAGDTGILKIARGGTVLMQWSMANFRDLDYHWITPTVFGSGTQMQVIVSGCTNACTPGIYYAGTLGKA